MKRVLMSLAALSATVLVPNMASAQASVDLTLVHGLPGVTADVAVDGTVVIDNFVPGSLANITSFAGQTLTNLTVTDDSTGDVVIGPIASVEVPASGSHSLVVHLDDGGTPVLSTFANNTDAVTSGEARLTLRHTAEAPAVDLIIGTERPIVAATNGQSGEVERPAGQLSDAQLAPTGEAAIATLPALDMAANTNTIVYVIGSTSADTLDFVVQIVDIAGAERDHDHRPGRHDDHDRPERDHHQHDVDVLDLDYVDECGSHRRQHRLAARRQLEHAARDRGPGRPRARRRRDVRPTARV